MQRDTDVSEQFTWVEQSLSLVLVSRPSGCALCSCASVQYLVSDSLLHFFMYLYRTLLLAAAYSSVDQFTVLFCGT